MSIFRFFSTRRIKNESDNRQDEEEEEDELNEDHDEDENEGEDEDEEEDEEEDEDDRYNDKNDNPLLPEEMCELPTFLYTENCDSKIIAETRNMLRKKYAKRPESFIKDDYDRMLADDWTVSRFLLRCRKNPKRAAKLMEQCGKFRQEFRMGSSKMSDFPIEFHKAGGLFRYAPDRVGNQTLYMRIKMHLRSSEMSKIMKEYILCAIEDCDKANNGRGTAIVFDLTGCGLQNVDPSFLFWLVFSFRNYCPKGLSYIIVYNLPWILNATARLAMSWLSSTNRKRMRFLSGDAIQDFIAPENLPDFLGGTCKLSYKQVPKGARNAEETAADYNLTREQSLKLRDVYVKFLKGVDPTIDIDADDEISDVSHKFESKDKDKSINC